MASYRTQAEPQAADQELMRRVVNRDEEALASLYDRYGGLVYSVAARVLRNEEAAEEVLQDTFQQLWEKASRFDPSRGSLAGWLLVSTRNRAISRLRRHDPAAESLNSEELSENAVAMPCNLESEVARNQLMERIRKAFSALGPGQKEALELAYFEGLTHSEIAKRTGEPLGTIKTRLRAALESLRRVLQP